MATISYYYLFKVRFQTISAKHNVETTYDYVHKLKQML